MLPHNLPEGAIEDLRRYLSYGWKSGRIAQLLNRCYGLELNYSDTAHLIRCYGTPEKYPEQK